MRRGLQHPRPAGVVRRMGNSHHHLGSGTRVRVGQMGPFDKDDFFRHFRAFPFSDARTDRGHAADDPVYARRYRPDLRSEGRNFGRRFGMQLGLFQENSLLGEGATLAATALAAIPIALALVSGSAILPWRRVRACLGYGYTAAAVITALGSYTRTGLVALVALIGAPVVAITTKDCVWRNHCRPDDLWTGSQ